MIQSSPLPGILGLPFRVLDHITLHRWYYFQPHQVNWMFCLQKVCDQLTIPLVPALRRVRGVYSCIPTDIHISAARMEEVGWTVVLGSLG